MKNIKRKSFFSHFSRQTEQEKAIRERPKNTGPEKINK